MSRRKIDPLRPLTEDEVAVLTGLSRSKSEPATRVARASPILAVARGDDYQRAAESIGRRSGDAVSHLVARFEEIIAWFEAVTGHWNRSPTPFVWGGKRAARRQRQRERRRFGGSRACASEVVIR
jgi:hypothetical protein